MSETFDWLKPSILWQRGGADMLARDFYRPALHEFTTDKFMDDFLASTSAPTPKPFSDTLAKPAKGLTKLKLFQPVHGNFYLTSASLCCHVPGFPDRGVLLGDGERVFFVMRKRVNHVEYAWSTSETARGWRSLDKPGTIPIDEERLPLFQTTTAEGRQIFFGYIPVASQDTYAAARVDIPASQDEDPRLQELDARFILPLSDTKRPLFGVDGKTAPNADTQLRISVYLLLDLWEYFDLYVPEVAAALRDNTTAALAGPPRDLTNYLQSKAFTGGTLTLGAALSKVAGQQAQLNAPGDSNLGALGYTNAYNFHDHKLSGLSVMRDKVKAALSNATAPAPIAVPKLSTQAGDRYVLRYVYERAQCYPAHLYVSRPTQSFELAPFFDPDAPGRNIRVGLPVDVSIAGLRKFKKNVGFLISKELNKKLEGMKGQEKAVLDNEASVSDSGPDIGFICSFSLPIITLCAFILLMIIVVLLNLVFWWIPLLKICFPIPLKAK
jgi:hypothetical protein